MPVKMVVIEYSVSDIRDLIREALNEPDAQVEFVHTRKYDAEDEEYLDVYTVKATIQQ